MKRENRACCFKAGLGTVGESNKPGSMLRSKTSAWVEPEAWWSLRTDCRSLELSQRRAALQRDGRRSLSRCSPALEWSPPSCPASCRCCVGHLLLFSSDCYSSRWTQENCLPSVPQESSQFRCCEASASCPLSPVLNL